MMSVGLDENVYLLSIGRKYRINTQEHPRCKASILKLIYKMTSPSFEIMSTNTLESVRILFSNPNFHFLNNNLNFYFSST